LTLYNHTALINSALKNNNNITIRSEKKRGLAGFNSYKLLNFYPRYKIFFFSREGENCPRGQVFRKFSRQKCKILPRGIFS